MLLSYYLCCVKGLSIRLLPFFALISSDPVDRFLLVALFWLISHLSTDQILMIYITVN